MRKGRAGAGSGRTGYNVLMMLRGGWIIISGAQGGCFSPFHYFYIYRVGQDGGLSDKAAPGLDISLNQSDMPLFFPHFLLLL